MHNFTVVCTQVLNQEKNIHELTVKTAPTRDESIIVSENTHIKTSVT